MNFASFKEMTRIEHSLFGLPFIIMGAVLPFKKIPFSSFISSHWIIVLWIILGFFLARISGMAFNQWLDWKIDAKNPRTKDRVIPSGRVAVWQAAFIAWVALITFLIVTYQINLDCLYWSFFAAVLIATYSLFKRIHWICHFILGLIHFLGPVMAWIAITGAMELSVIYLGAAAFCLVAGNDILYALQDMEFDKVHRIHSLPAKRGIQFTLNTARILHGFCLFFLLAVGVSMNFSVIYTMILITAFFLFIYYHFLVFKAVKNEKFTKMNDLFFWSNCILGFVATLLIVFEVVWRV